MPVPLSSYYNDSHKSSSSKAPTEIVSSVKRTSFSFDPMEEALASFAAGEFLVVTDDENRENEGDLIISASQCTTEKMAWLIKHSRQAPSPLTPKTFHWHIYDFSGYVCIALPPERLETLNIPMMVPDNQERHKTAYTVTVDYKHGKDFRLLLPRHPAILSYFYFSIQGTTTGISAHDRSLTVRALASPTAQSSDFTRPGHMVPLRAREGGVLSRKGHTESAVDLCFLTGQPPAGVLCELVNDDASGTMARRDDCRAFADRWGLKLISVEMLAEWRRKYPMPGTPPVSSL